MNAAGAVAVAQLGIGEVRHARVRPAPNKFAYPTYFLMLPMRSLHDAWTPAPAPSRRSHPPIRPRPPLARCSACCAG